MLLALLMLVAGLLGGPLGGSPELEAERLIGWAAVRPRLSWDGFDARVGIDRNGPARGGALERSKDGGGVEDDDGGGGVPLADQGAALGGGGVAFLISVFSAPGFLLIQRLRSGS